MTFDQAAIILLLLAMFGAFALEKFRVELVALTGLAAGFGLGLVSVRDVFQGFSSPAVITVVEVLLIVNVLARTRVVEGFARKIVRRFRSERAVLAIICATGALVSVTMNNIGALALMFPVTLSVCARLGIPSGRMLMALSFATLLGGLCSLTGTPANLVVNDWLISETGLGLSYFELGLVGGPVTVAGLIWLVLATPRLMRDAKGGAGPGTGTGDFGPGDFLCEATVPPDSSLIGQSLPAIEEGMSLHIHDVVRGGAHVFARREAIRIEAGDILLAEATIEQLDALQGKGELRWDGARNGDGADGEDERLDVVVMPDSIILGSHVATLESFAEHGVDVLALASRRRRIEGRFGDLQLGLGDVMVLGGPRQAIRDAALDAMVLPLSIRSAPGRHPDALRTILIFALGIAATAFGFAPPEIAFGGVVLAMALLGGLRLQNALQEMNWPIIILLASMIPLGAAVENSGAAEVIANVVVGTLPATDPVSLTFVVLLFTVMITPFVDNVSTAAVLSPVAASLSTQAGVPVEPLLVAVAIGASLDFLTPFGHHNNTVVMGAAGYRFMEFPRLGLPLLLICTATSFLFIWLFWLA